DTPDARLFADQLYATPGPGDSPGMFVDGVMKGQVLLRSGSPAGDQNGHGPALRVVGGPGPSTDPNAGSVVHQYAGATSNNATNIDVQQGGRVTYSDTWYETGRQDIDQSFKIDGPSVLVGTSFNYAVPNAKPVVTFGASFTGRFTLFGAHQATDVV